MAGNKFRRGNDSVFSHPVRTLKADEIEKISGGDDTGGNTGNEFGMKNVSAQDNQVRTMS